MSRLVLAGIVACAVWAAAHQDSGAATLSCERHPVKCQRALEWQRADRARLRGELRERWQLARPALLDAAFIAARVFGVDPWAMLRVSRCEVVEAYDPHARNVHAQNPSSGATGPWQFLRSTWQSTPFARWSPTNAYVAALATAQIVAHDGGYHQWTCRP